MKDWTGNQNSIFKTLGASNHTDKERHGEDFYATDPIAAELLCDVETFSPNIWEPACGMGHLSEVLKKRGYNVRSTDLIDRGYGDVQDFLGMDVTEWNGDIITNPPYKFALDFIYKALQIIPDWHKVAMFLKVQFLEGKERRELFNTCPPVMCMSHRPGFYAQRTGISSGCVTEEGALLLMLGLSGRRDTRAIQS